MSDVWYDMRYALRGLVKSPAFTCVAVLTLALGIGANTAMFTVLHAVLLRPLPYPSPEQLTMLFGEMPEQGLRFGRSRYDDVRQWRAQSKSFVDMAVYDPVSTRLTTPSGEARQIGVMRAQPNLLTMLGVRPYRGRFFSADEAEQRQRIVVISHGLWQTLFGGSDAAIGATVAIDDVPSTVVGVLPPDFHFSDSGLWEPHTMFPDWADRQGPGGSAEWFVLARLRPGVSIEQAQSELSGLARNLDDQRGASVRRGVSVVPLALHVVGPPARLALWMLTGAVFCVLLIGVTNITSLSLARNAGRVREIALRSALGASTGRLLRQLFIESLTLALVSGAAALLIAVVATPIVMALKPAGVASVESVGLHARMLWWTLGFSALAGILVGVAPAITAGRAELRPALYGGAKGSSAGMSALLTRRALVVAEFALAIVLLVGAGLLARSLLRVQDVDPGFETARILSMNVALPGERTNAQRTLYYRGLLEQVHALAGVERAAVIGDLFVGGSGEQTITVEASARGGAERLRLRRDEVSDRFFATVGMPVLRGRAFSDEDGSDTQPVAIVNETMARRLWPAQDAVGRRFKFGPQPSPAPWFTVVGVVGDARRQGPEHEPGAQMFEPIAQNPSRLATVLVRTSIDPMTMAGAVTDVARRADPRVAVYGVTTVADRFGEFQQDRRFQTSLVVAFSLIALLLAAIGIYGVVAYSMAARTREIGIRMAIGAQRSDIFRMTIGEGLKLSLAGVVVGLMGALWFGHVGSNLLFGVSPADPLTYAAVSLLLTAVAAAGCYFPARAAARVDPLVALRYE